MPNWKKLIVSGSDALLNSLTVSTTGRFDDDLTISGSSSSLILKGDGNKSARLTHVGGGLVIDGSVQNQYISIGSPTWSWPGGVKVYGDLQLTGSAGGTATFEGSTQSTVNLKTTTNSKNNYIVGTTAGAISFRPDGTESVFLQSGGNVGIGTSTPGEKLDVNGSVQANNFKVAEKIIHKGDAHTFIHFTSDTITFDTGGSTVLTLDSSQNVNATGTISGSDAYINDWNSVSASLSTLTQNQTLNSGGTVNYVARFESADTITTGTIRDDGSTVGINAAPSANKTLYIDGTIQATGEAFFSHLDIIGSGGNSRIRDDVQFKFGTNRIFGIQYNSSGDYLEFTSGSNNLVTLLGNGNATFAGDITLNGDNPTLTLDDSNGRSADLRVVGNEFSIRDVANNASIFTTDLSANPTTTTFNTVATFTRNVTLDNATLTLDPDSAGSVLTWKESDSNTIAGQLRGYANRGDIYLYQDGVKKTEISSLTDSFIPALHIGGTSGVSSGVLEVTGNTSVTGDLTVTGTVTAQEFHTEFVSASIIYESGSTKFGDTSDDTHDFTGSLTVTDGTINLGKIWNPGSGGSIGVYNGSGQQSIQLYGNILRNNQSSLLLNYGVTQDIHAYSGTTSYFTLDASAQSVGIGTASPGEKLTVQDGAIITTDSSGVNYAKLDRFGGLTMKGNGAGSRGIQTPNSDALTLGTNATERMRISSAGALKFNSYGSGNNTGTLAYTIGVDSSGNVIEFSGGSGGSVSSITGGADTRVAYFNGSDSLEGSANFTWDDTQLTIVGDVEADEFIGDLRGAVLFKAQAGEDLAKGDVVYISGISGNTTVVSKADADDANKMPAFGVAAAAASLNTPIDIYTVGTLTGLDTSGFTIGDELYVSSSAGELTATAPTGESSLIQKIAKVTRVDNAAGSIKISGAGRTNATPNLNEGRLFVGNASNQAVADGTIHVDIANSKVGIGTDNPAVTLHVDGWTRVNGGLQLDGNNRQVFAIDDTNLLLGTNNTERIRITSTGNVGIGTSNVSRINSTSTFFQPDEDGRFLVMNHNSGSFIMLETNATGGGDQVGGIYFNKTGNQSDAHIHVAGIDAVLVDHATDALDGGELRFFTKIAGAGDTSHHMLLDAAGNLGIGQGIDPAAKLHVDAGSSDEVARFVSSDNKAYIRISDDDTTGYISSENGLFSLGRNAGVNAANININSGNNVGIGTSSPAAKLDVHGRVDFANDLRLRGTDSAADQGVVRFYVNSNNELTIDSANNGNNLFVIDEGGQVGINTSSPSRTLDVNGEIQNNGIFRRAGNVIIKSTGSETMFGPGGSGIITFHNSATMTTGDETVRIDADGNLLLNNTSAGARLDIREDTNYAIRAEDASGHYFRVNTGGDVEMRGDLTVQGIITAQEFHTEFVSASIIHESGSSQFGNSADDNHIFTGSIKVTNLQTNGETLFEAERHPNFYFKIQDYAQVDHRVNGAVNAFTIRNTATSQAAPVLRLGHGTAGSPHISTYDTNEDLTIDPNGTGKTRVVGDISGSGDLYLGSNTNQIHIGYTGETAGNGKLKLYTDSSFNATVTSYQYNSNLDLKAGVSGSSYVNNWARIRLKDNNSGNGHIGFWVSGSEYVRIDNSGNVGIGTTSTSRKLHVVGGTEIDGTLFVEAANNQVRLIDSDSSGNFSVGVNTHFQIRDVGGNTTPVTVQAGTPGSTLFLKSDGYVGIGTSSPNNKLHIYSGSLRLEDGATSVTQLIPGGGGNSTLTFKGGNYIHNVYYETSWNAFRYARLSSSYNTSDSNFYLYKSDSSGGTAATTTISTGTSTFAAGVTVTGDIDADDITIDDWGSVSASLSSIQQAGGVNGTGAANKLAIWSDSDTVTSDTNLHWDTSNDRLGIGTATPAQKLHIQGSALLISGSGTAAIRAYPTSNQYEAQLKFTSNEMQYVWGGGVKAYFNPSNQLSFGDKDPGNAGAGAAIRDPKIGKFGSDVTGSFGIKTADIFRVYVSGSGNVGIGTAAPNQKLDVNGVAYFRGGTAADFGVGDTPSDAAIIIEENDFIYTRDNNNLRKLIGKSNTDIIQIGQSGTSLIDEIRLQPGTTGGKTTFYDDNTEIMVISGSGVGIGTTTPSEEFEVVGDAKVTNLGINAGAQSYLSSLSARLTVGGNVVLNDNNPLIYLRSNGTGNDSDIRYQTALKFTNGAGTTHAYINSSGNVGIGDADPLTKLHVKVNDTAGTKSNYGKLLVEDTDAQLDLLSTSAGSWGSAINFIEAAGSSANTDVWSIARQTTGGTGDSSLRINFGTSNQHDNANKFKLDTAGNITIPGGITVGDSNADTAQIGQKHLLGYCENTDVDTGTEDIKSLPLATYQAVFFDYVVKNGTNLRAGTVTAVHDGTNVEFTDTSTKDLGDTSAVTLSVDISGSNMRLRATTTSDNWIVKANIRGIKV